ncbi:MAG: glycerophosphodiester phosphodiesterase, partial [Actinobacteria bacterium]|nr:glycerophosphodiester phosphodiesterase [Actinomycetota bacterium]
MKLIAHRGGRGFGDDNTLEAMEKAVGSGVRMIETDVRVSADGQLVICHGATVSGHIVSRITYDELKRSEPERPLLVEILNRLANSVAFNLEIKDAP